VLDDRPREHDPEAAADAHDRRDQRDAVRHALSRELVADDREREWEHGAAGALDHPRDDHHADRCREAGKRGAECEDDEHGHERALLAEHVAQAAGDRRNHGGAEEVGGEDPRGAGRRRVEVLLDRQQRRRDERL
jgi:hypothetical protein